MKAQRIQHLVFVSILLGVTVAFVSCSSTGSSNAPPPNPVTQGSATPAATSGTSVPSAPRPLFYDFSDIPVPQELDLQAGESFVVQSGPFKTGLLTLRGRVDLNSVINFFQLALPREGWKTRGDFRYQRSILIFEKADKISVIRLYEGMVYTYVEIFVAPVTK
jgi:hypothetical protein